MLTRERRTKKLSLCALFVALLIVSGFVRIPMPFAPLTLQVQVALMAGVLLGVKWGVCALLSYLALGLLGLPIFSGGGGLSYVVQPTFGYLLGLVLGAAIVGGVAHSGVITHRKIAFGLLLGLAVVYAVGAAYALGVTTLYLGQTASGWEFFLAYVLIPLPKDLILTAVLVPLCKRILHHVI